MAKQWDDPIYVDGDFTVPVACGLPQFTSPVPSTTEPLVFTQEWCVFLKDYDPEDLGTPHPSAGQTPDYSAFRLADEGPRQDLGGGIVKWVRTYAKLPESHDEWETYVYNFIGTAPLGPLASFQIGRRRFSERVMSRVQHDYFLLGAAVTDPISGNVYTPADPGGIEQIFAFIYIAQQANPSGFQGTDIGGVCYGQDSVCDQFQALSSDLSLYATVPNATQYMAMIQDVVENGWGADKSWQKIIPGTGGDVAKIDLTGLTYYGSGTAAVSHTSLFGQLVAENSTIERWRGQGSIYLRKTRYVLAQ